MWFFKNIGKKKESTAISEVQQDKQLQHDPEIQRKAAMALNLCTVSVSQIVQYNDLNILEQEYDAVLNNINIQNIIKDEALLNVLKEILDTITFYKIQEGDKKWIEKEYQNKMSNAIWSSLPNMNVIIAGGSPWGIAIAAVSQIGIGYMNYRKIKNESFMAKEKAEWELQKSAIEQLNALRRSLFETAWRLSDTYNFNDEWRLTEKQIYHYNDILLDADPYRRYERLAVMDTIFEAFPPFWYNKARTAIEIANEYKDKNPELSASFKKNALSSLEKFDSIYIPLMREDAIAASAALDHIALLGINKDNAGKIEKLLRQAINLAGENFDILQNAVFVHFGLGEIADAEKILRLLINENYNTRLNARLLSRIYCEKGERAAYDFLVLHVGKSNVMPWESDFNKSKEILIDVKANSLCSSFSDFIDQVVLKYRKEMLLACVEEMKVITYTIYAPREEIDSGLAKITSFPFPMEKLDDIGNLRSLNLTDVLRKSLNHLFFSIYNDSLFSDVMKESREVILKSLNTAAEATTEQIRKINVIEEKIHEAADKLYKKVDGHWIFKDIHAEDTRDLLKLTRELKKLMDFDILFSSFKENICTGFNESLKRMDIEAKENDILLDIDKLYVSYNIEQIDSKQEIPIEETVQMETVSGFFKHTIEPRFVYA